MTLWSPKYNLTACKEYGTTKRKHYYKGLCTTCGARLRYKLSATRRAQQKSYAKTWGENNPDKLKIITSKANKKWLSKNKEKANKTSKKYYAKNKESILKRGRDRYWELKNNKQPLCNSK